ncbi:3-oxoacyl-[acyl-carrier-protein] reductase [Hutsoniella sourekii]|uniref:3-oxoacyl-[acyl-carrier-protein] reductase n=1 Tax=Hutsoniella sourekii TaxID=87650 RepID=UPI0004858B65|nr:3-oxoacyl-[acyl-carrier-protein] reductase [Hutsoniella sourekii]
MTLTCLITGSSRGIGLSIAKHLAAAGHQVILNSRKSIEAEILEEFQDYALQPGQMIGDISDFSDSERMVQEVLNQYGRVDVLVNNAGITKDGLLMRMSEADFDSVINTNLKGTFNMIRHLAKPMIKERTGTIINMSSVVGLMGNAGQANYAASKAGVIGLTKSVARELAGRGITVNAVAPGFIETDMTDQLSDKIKDAMLSEIPAKRFGQVEEIAQAVDFLIANRYVTGQVIEVNGGLHM